MPRSLPVALAVVAGLAVLAGCSPTPNADPTPATPVCYPAGVEPRAELGDPVDCASPHGLELLARVPSTGLPALIDEVGEQELFDNPGSPAWARYFGELEGCAAATTRAFGLDAVAVDGVGGLVMRLRPAGDYAPTWAVPTLEQYRAGDTATRCFLQWFADGEPTEVTMPAGARLADFATGGFGGDRHACFVRSRAGADYRDVRCDEPHNGEYLFLFDGRAALGDAWVEGYPANGPREDYAELDAFCTRLLRAVTPEVLGRPGWRVWGDRVEADGPAGQSPHYCGMLSDRTVDTELLAG
ncbi:MAG: septum formation family protein [Actinomycetales bacterium]|nr:septum formation family protein [Actinomycetales bacterium]